MSNLARLVRTAVLAAGLLHALVGVWGPWLHGVAPLDGPIIRASAPAGGEALQDHARDCALCHSASLHKAPARRAPLVPAQHAHAERPAEQVVSPLPIAPRRGAGARAPPLTV